MEENNKFRYAIYLGNEKISEISDLDGRNIAIRALNELGAAITVKWLTKDEPGETSIPLKDPKYLRCGSKKRYTKLLMSKGIDRNEASAAATLIGRVSNKLGLTYQKAWLDRIFAEIRVRHPSADPWPVCETDEFKEEAE